MQAETRDSRDGEEEGRRYRTPLISSEVNMTNCNSLVHDLFNRYGSIQFNQLIAYWMMREYLGPVASAEEAYQKGLDVIHDLIRKQGVLQISDGYKGVIQLQLQCARSAQARSCNHRGFCIQQAFNLYVSSGVDKIGSVILADGERKQRRVAVNWDSAQYSKACWYGSKPLQYLAHFNPTLDSLKPLLENVGELYLLLLRGCESLPPAHFPLQILKSLAVLEISGSSCSIPVPENTISELRSLQHLHLSHLLIENLPDDFFCRLRSLSRLIIRNCSKLASLRLPPFVISGLELLDLSHCTALRELVLHGDGFVPLQAISLSHTALTEIPSVQFDQGFGNVEPLFTQTLEISEVNLSGAREMNHIDKLDLPYTLSVLDLSATQIEYPEFRSGNEPIVNLTRLVLGDCTRLRKLPSMSNHDTLEILDISGCDILDELPEDFSSLRNLTELNLCGCSGLGVLREGIFDQMTCLEKLDLSGTKVKHLPSFANLTCLSVLSLRDLELDSLETLKSLSDLVQLDLKGLKITSSQELQLDEFLESLEKLQILNLSQTSVAKLPDMSNLAGLRELILADCQSLRRVPDLQTLPNLQVLDLSLDDGYAVNCQVEIELSAPPSSIQKLVLTNRCGVQELFPLGSIGNLEFLDLRGTDVTSIPHYYVEQIKCIRLPAGIDLSEVGLSRMRNSQQVIDLDGTVQTRVSKPAEIHIVSHFVKPHFPSSNQASSSYQPSGFERFRDKFKGIEALISEMQCKFNYSTASHENPSVKLQSLHSDLKHIQRNIDRLKRSRNCKISEELLQELLAATTHLSAAEFVEDPTSFMELLRIVVKLKLLIPRPEEQLPEASETTKKRKKKISAWLERSKKKQNGVDIPKELTSSDEYQDLLSSYEALTAIEKQCLLSFSVFPCNDQDNGNNTAGSLVVKKRMLIHWWVGEGFISSLLEANMETYIDEIGERILKVLTNKRFIQAVMEKGRETTSFQMHPFVHSFVSAKAREVGFFDFNRENGKLTPHFTRSKRACLLKSQDNFTSSCRLWENHTHSPTSLKSFTHIRTLFNVNESMVDIKPQWFSKMKHLSVLHLGSWRSENQEPVELVDQMFFGELKNMKQLRLLSLQGLPNIMKLPDSVCKLTGLTILDLRECSYLEELPTDIGSLQNLTHLDMTDCRLLTKLPKGLRLLSKLEVLKGFVISSSLDSGRKACVLTDLLNLKKMRILSIVVSVSVFPDDKELQVLREMDNLRKLKVSWENDYNIQDRELRQPATSLWKWKKLKCWEHESGESDKSETSRSKRLDKLEKLELWCFPNKNAPHWLNPAELKKLKKLYIVGGSLTKLDGGTNQNKWNVTTLRLKYLPKLDVISWRDLKTMFPSLTYLDKYQCRNLLFPCDDEGVWTLGSE